MHGGLSVKRRSMKLRLLIKVTHIFINKIYIVMLGSALGYLIWPVMIIISYWLIRLALRHFEKKQTEE